MTESDEQISDAARDKLRYEYYAGGCLTVLSLIVTVLIVITVFKTWDGWHDALSLLEFGALIVMFGILIAKRTLNARAAYRTQKGR